LDTAQRIALLQSLASTIAGYRRGEISPITIAHVETWLNQFDMEDQPVILAELDAIMKRLYFSKDRVKEYLRTLLKEDVIGNGNPSTILPSIRFLTIQKEGSSQWAMLLILDEILQEDFGLSIAQCGTGNVHTYIYIDDAIYTGSRLRYDLTEGEGNPAWIPKNGLPNCRLVIYTIVSHLDGMNYAFQHINRAVRKKGMIVKMQQSLIIDNRRRYSGSIECLWPEAISDDLYVDFYTSNLHINPAQKNWKNDDLFRPHGVPSKEGLFSSAGARNVLERAFLQKGARIIAASRNPAASVRPLGFEKRGSLGFGTLFVTYRNIANNCPVVLWWGDSLYPATHSLGMWYPLFPSSLSEKSRPPSVMVYW